MQNNTFSTLFVGQNFIKLNVVDSTNSYLKIIASKSEPLTDGTVIMADHQTSGRGQQGNVWLSEPGMNICTSIYFKLNFLPVNKQFYLNMAISLAVANSLNTFLPGKIEVKWPNDIYYQGKKLGGILIENTLTGMVIKSSVVGIGLNVNQLIFHPSIINSATSLAKETSLNYNLIDILSSLLVQIEQYYLKLKSSNYAFLHEQYLMLLYNYNKIAKYKADGHIFEGRIINVEETGQLVVETAEGLRIFNFKEIEFIHTI